MLNLFAYTGASTLAAAEAGAEVTHVDSARTSVAWARRNAAHSRLADRPIRWIVEDARSSSSASSSGESDMRASSLIRRRTVTVPAQAWQLSEHLPDLLEDCGALLDEAGRFVLLTCHAPGLGPEELRRMLQPPCR